MASILPYGDWRHGAKAFASELCENADYVSIRSVMQASGPGRTNSPLARKLAQETMRDVREEMGLSYN